MRTLHYSGLVYPRSKAISDPASLRRGQVILAYDGEYDNWYLALVLSVEYTAILVKGQEGNLAGFTWRVVYDSLRDPELYRLTGGSPKFRSPLSLR